MVVSIYISSVSRFFRSLIFSVLSVALSFLSVSAVESRFFILLFYSRNMLVGVSLSV